MTRVWICAIAIGGIVTPTWVAVWHPLPLKLSIKSFVCHYRCSNLFVNAWHIYYILEFANYEDEEFLATFMRIMKSNQNKNNTYKFALARFLLDYSYSRAERRVRYSEIAPYFLKYYWPQVCRSKLRQGPPHLKPKITSILQTEFGESQYPNTFATIKRKFPRKVENCEREITRHCFGNVIHRFQKVGGRTETKIFYDYFSTMYNDSADNALIDVHGGILLNLHAMAFFKRNYEILHCAVIMYWVKFLERINFGTPHLTSKVMALSGVHNQGRFKKCLEPFTIGCFYCKGSLKKVKIHVDHVLPFDYMHETELWDLVLSCQKCNCRKLANLPPERFIEQLIERNGEYRTKMNGLGNSLYALGTDHKQALLQYYNNAKMQQFYVDEDFP